MNIVVIAIKMFLDSLNIKGSVAINRMIFYLCKIGEQGLDGAPGLPGPQGENYEVSMKIFSFVFKSSEVVWSFVNQTLPSRMRFSGNIFIFDETMCKKFDQH